MNRYTAQHYGVCLCVHCCVCTLDGLIAEHKFRVWVTILSRMSLDFTKVILTGFLHLATIMKLHAILTLRGLY